MAANPLLDALKIWIAGGFSFLVAMAFVSSLSCMIYFRARNSKANIDPWLNVFLTCLGYVVGILTGLLGLSVQAGP